MRLISIIFLQFMVFSAGVVLSGGVFALIASIGIVPRFASKTKTQKHIRQYETSIILGGIGGTFAMTSTPYLPIGRLGVAVFGFALGIFVGALAVSLAEILNVIPILSRRGELSIGLPWFMLSIALGKLTGSIIYNFIPGFYYA